jgi:nucleoside-diphosphate-sugar epimerase
MKILITGGTGFIGSHLIDHFLDYKNTEIFALSSMLQAQLKHTK